MLLSFRTLHDRPPNLLPTALALFPHRCRILHQTLIEVHRSYERLQKRIFRDLEIISYPHTVLIKERDDHHDLQLVPGSGEGQNLRNKSLVWSGSGCANQRGQATGLFGISSHWRVLMTHGFFHPFRCQRCSCPLVFQLGVGSDPLPSGYLMNFSWLNASLCLSMK